MHRHMKSVSASRVRPGQTVCWAPNIKDAFDSLHIIHNHFGEMEDADRIKTLIETTKETLEMLLNPDKKKTQKTKK